MKNFFSLIIILNLLIGGPILPPTGNLEIPGQLSMPVGGSMNIGKIIPQFEFIKPKGGEILTGEIQVKGRVKKAISVEFYYQPPGAILAIYLGKGEKKEENLWEYSWNSNLTPNGEYQFFAKIINQYGEYESEKIKITIGNESPKDEKKEEELKKEHQQVKEEIEKREKEIIGERQTIEEKIEEMVKTKKDQKETKKMVEELTKKVKEASRVKKEMKKAERAAKIVEEKVKNLAKELKEIQEIPELQRKTLEEEKKNQLETEKIEKQKTQEKITILKEELERKIKEKEKVKEDLFEKIKPEEKEEISATLENLEEKVKAKEEIKIEQEEVLLKDSDEDGLSDEEEIRVGTNSFNPDSDGDGFLDKIEIETGYDPSKAGPADKIIYQNPQKVMPKKAEIYRVENVEKVVLPSGEMGLKFSGKALPNSFVTLYIFSTPIVVVIKTDQNGHWEYTLDKPLTDGEHQVYATLTNNQGQIEARSETFVFIKTGEKIFRIFEIQAEAASPVQTLQKPFIILILAIIILALVIALIIIGFLTRKKIEKIKEF